MRGVLAASLALALCAGCGDPEPPSAEEIAEARRAAVVGGGGISAAPAPAPPTKADPSARWDSRPSRPTSVPSAAPSGAAAGETAPGVEEQSALPQVEARDLAAELRSAIGPLRPCIDFEAARRAGDRLVVRVSAYVSVTGIVTRAEASASALEPAALRCVEARALAAHLQSPIEGAPMRVSTVLEFDVRVTTPPEEETGPRTRALPPGAATPGTTLPAIGAEGRPAGSVAPDLTLPAVVP